ncbi:response regulator transcription factor [Chryseobacterium fistulae]|uniref:Oxygen regulatory protein NreC n=1 Tax=Chryseobacterium fistulae TaxID=2675058 RepID=A0A6N4XT23_9FLAO|nr:response regulator transcription factor [Chryseobacterium fistulae]CAA7392624.1 Oxygen regulatory protein NreC [Chryseobacterium fistulae]
MKKKILIADDHEVVRLGTEIWLNRNFKDYLIDFAINYDEVKEKLTKDQFDLLLLDIDMPGSIFRGMIRELKTIQEDLLIIIFSNYKEEVAMQYITEGADGFLNKLSEESTFVNAIKSVFENGYYYSQKIVKQMISDPFENDPRHLLSKREFEIFELLAKGNGNIEISNILNIEQATVGTYKRRIYEKLRIDNIIELSRMYNNLH